MLIKVFLALVIVILVLVVVIATRPAAFHIERATRIGAPPERIFALVNDLHARRAWSPWEKMDPQMTRGYEGSPSGPGAIYTWEGNKKVGAGRMTIERADAPSLITIKLEFFRPFAAINTATFTFKPDAGGTKVVWAMDGRNNFGAKAASMFMNIDKLVGGDFERGLAALKAVAEGASVAK